MVKPQSHYLIVYRTAISLKPRAAYLSPTLYLPFVTDYTYVKILVSRFRYSATACDVRIVFITFASTRRRHWTTDSHHTPPPAGWMACETSIRIRECQHTNASVWLISEREIKHVSPLARFGVDAPPHCRPNTYTYKLLQSSLARTSTFG